MSRPLAPCGTLAAFRRHKRLGQPVDKACEDAALHESRVKKAARTGRPAPVAPTVDEATVEVVDGRIVITASLEQARLIAASVMDRALALEPNRYSAAGSLSTVEASTAAAALRTLHRRISQTVRATDG